MKTYRAFLTKLRFKKNWLKLIAISFLFLLSAISIVLPNILNSLSNYEPISENQVLYKDALRVSYLEDENIVLPKGVKTSNSYIQDSDTYSISYLDQHNIRRTYNIDSAALLEQDKIVGTLPSKGEAILGTSLKMNDIPNLTISNIQSSFAFSSFKIVGYIYLEDLNNETLFLSEDDISITSLYQEYKDHLSSSTYMEMDFLYFDSNLNLNQILINDNVSNAPTYVSFYEESKEVTFVETYLNRVSINPNLFSSHKKYQTAIFNSYHDKLDFIENNNLVSYYDNFNVDSNNVHVILNNTSIIYLPLVLLPLSLFLLFIIIKYDSFEKNIMSINKDKQNLKLGHYLFLITATLISIILFMIIYFIRPLFIDPLSALYYLSPINLLLGFFIILIELLFCLSVKEVNYENK